MYHMHILPTSYSKLIILSKTPKPKHYKIFKFLSRSIFVQHVLIDKNTSINLLDINMHQNCISRVKQSEHASNCLNSN